ncbi:uncharacterized protein LY89DRAFT_656240 [Mollisia scopiformis]|uniref:Zn(2)-C6 fungal-type domain-containing protein n=1 Tax=Mollisia scopiformis TaxID=149040 RepID=A0A132BDY6_MOLSC|nr:uncharacterized protein LY89DRAFT_656240 [Mollisia scopiformis]KUJ10463.1 hypothetical protein LY89DRAFT_656240 [Mollisia scopiformis]
MATDYVTQFRRLRDEFRNAQEGGCANVDKALNLASFDSSWPTPGSEQHPSPDAFASGLTGNSSDEVPTSSPGKDLPSFTGAGSGIAANAFASGPSVREEEAASHLANPVASEIYPEHRPRKGHKKSRGGCFNCKKRKIKCQENQPACRNCTRKKLKCEYPAPKTLSALRSSFLYSPNPVTSVNLQSTPTVFTLTDMRLFHHYLLDAYPHLPVGNETAWLSQVPLIAHHNQYLMHAILGVAASHLELITGDDLSSVALHHRVRAIQGSGEALTQKNRAGSDGDALLASCYLLTFQSSYMKDGIPEFFQFVRGCTLVSNQLREEKLPMAFFLTAQDHFEFMEGRLMNLPVINPGILDGANISLDVLPPILELPVHFKFYDLLVECIAALRISSLQGYFKFITIYQAINLFDNQEFTDFSDPTNTISRILVGHFFAIQLMMLPILDREWGGRTKTTPCRMNLDWVARINDSIPSHMSYYLDWPTAVADAVLEELSGIHVTIPKLSILRKKIAPGKDVVLGWNLKRASSQRPAI